MPLGAFRLNTLARAMAASAPTADFGLYKVLDNPNAYGTSLNDFMGYAVATSDLYTISSASAEDDAGGADSGKAYIYNNSTGALLYTLNNPNAYSTSAGDRFGYAVGISDNYAIVGAPFEDDASGTSQGKAYIYSTSTGSLLYTLDSPNPYVSTANDQFGDTVAISNNYAIVGSRLEENDAGVNASGRAYIYSTATGSLLYTLNNPNAYDVSTLDQFGTKVAISNNYAIVSAPTEDDAGGVSSGKAYIYSTTTGSLLYTLDNPNAYSTSSSDQFGNSVAISESYAIVGAQLEDDAGGSGSGKAYIYSTTTGSLLYTLDNPNAYSTSASDQFGYAVGITNNYAIVSAPGELDASAASTSTPTAGKAYIYSTATGELLTTLDNPNAFLRSGGDVFGFSVGISDSYAVIGAYQEKDATSISGPAGKAYMYSADPADHITISPTGVEFVQSVTTLTSTIVIPATALVGDIAVLFDMSTTITNTVPSGWTSISGVAATGIRTNISYRVLTSGQPGATISGMAGTTRKIMMLFRGASLTPTISLSTPGVQSTTAAPTNQSITATQATNIYFAAYGKTTSTTPTTTLTMTNYTSTLVTSVSTSGIFARYIVANPGANSVTQSNATVTMSDAGTNTLQSFRMTIS